MAITFASNLTQRNYRWTDFKAIKASHDLLVQYDDDGTMYTIYGYDGPEVHMCQIWQGNVPDSAQTSYSQAQNDSDKSDFETNYKPTANQSMTYRWTYSAAIKAFSPGLAATDIFTISGTAGKRVCVTLIEITGTQTLTGTIDVVILKRSTANTGGTSTTLTNVPHSSSIPSAGATVKAYTANPTVGTLVGNVRTGKLLLPAVGVLTSPLVFSLGVPPSAELLCVDGASESICINFSGSTPVGANLDINVEWIEY